MTLPFQMIRNTHEFFRVSEAHTHPEAEVLVCLSDGGQFVLGETVYPLVKGAVFLVKRDTPHYCVVEVSSYERCILHISDEAMREISGGDPRMTGLPESGRPFSLIGEEELERIDRLSRRYLTPTDSFGGELERTVAAMQLLLELLRLLHREEEEPDITLSKQFVKIRPVMDYIRQHYNEEIRLDELSAAFFISKYHLCRLFREATGFSVGEYVINYRIRQACSYLQQDMSVQAVGEAVGYGNVANFIRTFRKITGSTPGQYARRSREAER